MAEKICLSDSQCLKKDLLRFFKELLATSKREFHDMFKRTYGIIYEQNSYVFTDLFEELERYYTKGQVDLGEAMETFFSTLYQKMFTVLNAQYDFDEKYLGCVGEHMKELKPFGDVPHKLSVQLKRSFVATRTFSQALNVATDVVTNMVKINPSPDCVRALTKMTGCPACQGLPELKACSNYCINVMKGCLAYQAELDGDWNNFVDAMEKVTDRLLGPFNIEMVVEPIDIKISEAIMNFQENGPEVSQRVFSGCGKPLLGRRRRDTTELEFESLQFGRSEEDQSGQSNFVPTLDKLVKDIRQKVKDTKQFWSHLPYQICNNDHVAASPSKDDSCWNGAMKARYELQIAGDGISNQQTNPEVAVDVNRPSSLLNEQMFALKTITSKLKNAYNGLDVEWIDIEESSYGSGSGSGDGSDTEDDLEGSGDSGHFGYGSGTRTGGSSGGTKQYPQPTNNDIDDTFHPVGSGGEIDRHGPRNNTSGGSSTTGGPQISVTRAVTSYLLSIVVMWFGGMFSDWL
ncbi:glypican-6 isoform X2 [Zootermopsis nevadensis]|uniref:glypican-6 isoform X2 n=1 Tax=Zootermopsis nevadensis TaxID=136037 RepID=UPI000B8E9598|nr:glypican-6 isoform X2 [Zootermopsis nevadensis]